MTREEAVQLLLDELPEFRPYYEDSDGRPMPPDNELLIHVVMGDLARFYMARAIDDSALAQRYWKVVERLLTDGDQAVENAAHVSLIEWFAWGDDDEQDALVAGGPYQGPRTKAVRAYYLLPER